MAFIDELQVHIKAGAGGDGVVRWLRERHKPKGGPNGGDGGAGGSVYIQAVRDLSILRRYAHQKEFQAEDGADGEKQSRTGKGGEDLILELPVGAKVTNLTTGEVFQLEQPGEQAMILEGGRGGLGNERFKSSVNQQPMEWTAGTPGEEADFLIELEIIADLGLIGLPSAGKSTLLNELTNAESKVGSYHFTTLEPHLGDMYGYIIADIPGLIAGASQGRGLGHSFLRHIKKTRLLLHCVSLESEDILRDYQVIRSELGRYDRALSDKPEKIVLTKADTRQPEAVAAARQQLEQYSSDLSVVSVLDENSVKTLRDELIRRLKAEE